MNVSEFGAFFKVLYLPLGMYALRLVNDADVAEDIVQDAFVKAWQFVDSGGCVENFRAYMYMAVRNGCVSYMRGLHDVVGVDAIPEVDEGVVDTSVRDARIWRAIDELPSRCRNVFLLSKRDGLSNEEIAEELGVSIKTVKNQMTKAYSRLRESLSSGHKPFFLPFL